MCYVGRADCRLPWRVGARHRAPYHSPTTRRPCIRESPSLLHPARFCKVGNPDCASPRPAARPKDSHRLVPLDFERVTRGEVFSGFSARLGIDAAKACAAAAAVPNSFTNAGIHLGRVSPGCGL